MPTQHGRTAVVTGTGGLGFETALALAAAGATVVVAGRDPARGAEAVQRVRARVPRARVSFEVLDLASLQSIAACGDRLRRLLPSLDLLINNAGVMTPPVRRETQDGFELQLGTNYLGHFALTAHLLPLLRAGARPRVVSVSSVAARNGAIRVADLQCEEAYVPMAAYAQSKLACLMFALELETRSEAAGWGVQSVAAHPGISRTELLPNGAGSGSAAGLARRGLWFLFQPASQGALPTLYAATADQARGGGYYGPDRLSETRGYPRPARVPPQALDAERAAWLWDRSAALTGVSFPTR